MSRGSALLRPPSTSHTGEGALAPPATRLRPRRRTHWRDGTIVLGAGLMSCGALSLQSQPGLGGTMLTASAVAGAGMGVLGERDRSRRLLGDRVVEAVKDTLDAPYLDRAMVRLSAWTWGWPGTPRRIRLHYKAASQDLAPEWKAMVLEVLGRRLMGRYRITGHDQLGCVLYLELDTRREAGGEMPPAQVRAVAALARQIDKSVELADVEVDADGQLESITVRHQAGDKMAFPGQQARVERMFDAMHPGRWRAKWDTTTDTVRFEQRPVLPGSVWLPTDKPADTEDLLANYEKVAIPYAIDEDGEEIVWRPAVVPHMLITGETGSGKTSTGHSVVGKVTQFGWPAWIADGKGVEFLLHRTWPNVQVVATSVAQQVAMIYRAWLLMEHRYDLIEHHGYRPSDFTPLLVVLDEWAEMVAEMTAWYAKVRTKDDPRQLPVLQWQQSLARKGRTARIHMIVSLQRPDVSLMGGAAGGGGEARSNFGQRISVGRLDPQGSVMMWNRPGIGSTIPRGVRQRAITTNAGGVPIEAQCYRFPAMDADLDSEQGRLREALRPEKTQHPRMLILPPEAGDNGKVGFEDVATAGWVLAEDRPDLDPVVQGTRTVTRDVARRESSAMSVLDLGDGVMARATAGITVGPAADDLATGEEPAAAAYVDEYDAPLALDNDDYPDAELMLPADLQVGDLITVDEADGGWAVVDDVPEPDALDADLLAVSWRDDADQYGSLSLPADALVAVRRPEDYEERA